MTRKSVARGAHTRITQHRRCDHEFLDVLAEDFGISHFALNSTFMGVSATPKEEAIRVCEWAIRAADGDVDKAGDALRAWAKKRRQGNWSPAFDPACAECGAKDTRLHQVPEDHLSFFEDDALCDECARRFGVV